MVPYLKGVNSSCDTPYKKPFGSIMAVAGRFFLEAISAPYIYTKMLKSYPIKEVLRIFMRFLWVGAFFDFLMMVFKIQAYPKKQEKKENKESPIELYDK